MIPFTPKTNNVNGDRLYFTEGQDFIKMDSNFGRGRQEADILTLLQDSWYAPRLRATFERPGYFCNRMELCPGETLENIKATLSEWEKRLVVQTLLRVVEDLLHRCITHGDINESNVLFDRASKRLTLIDWETGRLEDGLQDVYGEPWGLVDLLGKLK